MNSSLLDRLLRRLETLHPKYIDLSLNRLTRLLEKLNNPHLKLPPVIHIAGTNGKGSTLSFIRQILLENNYKVHSYTSPHLEFFSERFFISNKKNLRTSPKLKEDRGMFCMMGSCQECVVLLNGKKVTSCNIFIKDILRVLNQDSQTGYGNRNVFN